MFSDGQLPWRHQHLLWLPPANRHTCGLLHELKCFLRLDYWRLGWLKSSWLIVSLVSLPSTFFNILGIIDSFSQFRSSPFRFSIAGPPALVDILNEKLKSFLLIKLNGHITIRICVKNQDLLTISMRGFLISFSLFAVWLLSGRVSVRVWTEMTSLTLLQMIARAICAGIND